MGVQSTESASKFVALARQAALSVAVAAAVGGAVFAPAAAAQAATAGHAVPQKICPGSEGCFPDAI